MESKTHGQTFKSWPTKKLGEIVEKPELKKAPIGSWPYVEIGDVDIENKSIIFKDKKSIRGAIIAPADSVLASRVRPTRGAIVYIDKDYVVSSAFSILKPKLSESFSKFLFYWLGFSKIFFQYLQKKQKGSNYPSVRDKDILNFKIHIPPLKIQRKIVERLDAIKKTQELNEKQIALVDELFQSLLQKKLNPAGKDWEIKKLGEVCEFYNGKAHEKIIVENGKYIVVNSKFISSDGEIVKYSNHNLVPLITGDIAIVMSDIPNGKALAKCFFVNQDDKFTLNQRIGLVRSNNFEKAFLYYQLNRNKYFLRFDDKQSQTNLRKNDILNCPLFIPKTSEQKQIVEKLSAVQEYKKKLLEQKQKLQELFESVLNKSFKGQL